MLARGLDATGQLITNNSLTIKRVVSFDQGLVHALQEGNHSIDNFEGRIEHHIVIGFNDTNGILYTIPHADRNSYNYYFELYITESPNALCKLQNLHLTESKQEQIDTILTSLQKDQISKTLKPENMTSSTLFKVSLTSLSTFYTTPPGSLEGLETLHQMSTTSTSKTSSKRTSSESSRSLLVESTFDYLEINQTIQVSFILSLLEIL